MVDPHSGGAPSSPSTGYVLGLGEIHPEHAALVGGKAQHLGELARIGDVHVPRGCCVTTDAFRRVMADAPSVHDRLDRLSRLEPADQEAIRALSAEIRGEVEAMRMPGDVAAAITSALARLGEDSAYAVRSSATAEDLPTSSFAGQHDSYLNVVGPAAILRHVSRCWASLFTERAVVYRLHNGLDHRQVAMAVVVQQMVFPDAAGVLFTADPVTSNRTVATVEAGFGLGEALVAGRVDADVYRVRGGAVVDKAVAAKSLAVHALPSGGTQVRAIEPGLRERQALTDEQVVRLTRLGRSIEAHFAHPQDIEWCLVDDGFQIVQSRPITTLFPIPPAGDGRNHVYISVGHQQMMTDAMRPLGLSVWQLTTPRPMAEVGGRLFVDVTDGLASPASRDALLDALGRSDPLIRDALESLLDRGDFIRSLPHAEPGAPSATGAPPLQTDPLVVAELIERSRASLAVVRRDIEGRSGADLLDFILEDLQELKRLLFDPRGLQVIMAAVEATWWLNDRLRTWLDDEDATDTLTRSVPHDVTSEMGLALLDVADTIRPHPDVVAFLRDVRDESFVDQLPTLAGGREAHAAITAYLEEYGMRCAGEIDITRPRWSERPSTLVPVILGHVETVEPGESRRRFARGRQAARDKETEILERVRALPDGRQKADQAKEMIDLLRTFVGYREYPKYGMISRYLVYKQALLAEADRLVGADVLRQRDDIFFLELREIRDVVRTGQVDDQLIRRREEAYKGYRALTPPRVLTSDGETLAGAYRRDDVPAGALTGLPVSAGRVEGRARVISDMAQADLEPGDILVTTSTDPSWSPAFVAISALVTEVGGLMTHGAVVAREYGLPAVMGVERAIGLIRDGQRIRVDGTHGYVEILPADPLS